MSSYTSTQARRVTLNKALVGLEGMEAMAAASPSQDNHNADHHHTTDLPPGNAAPRPPAQAASSAAKDFTQRSDASDHPERGTAADHRTEEGTAPVHQGSGRNHNLNWEQEKMAQDNANRKINNSSAESQQPDTPSTH